MKIDWVCQNPDSGNDDFIAVKGDYLLHVEAMGRRCWYWAVYFKGAEVDHSAYHSDIYDKSPSTQFQAKLQCEKAFQKLLDGEDDDN